MPNKRTGGYRASVDAMGIVDINNGLVSTGECAALVQHYSRVGRAEHWRKGADVKGNTTIRRGTAIATFVDGVYPNDAHGNHAAFYVSQDNDGVTVVEQWNSLTKPQSRHIPWNDATKTTNRSNSGAAFSIIEVDINSPDG